MSENVSQLESKIPEYIKDYKEKFNNLTSANSKLDASISTLEDNFEDSQKREMDLETQFAE
jgi:hypothetical protein